MSCNIESIEIIRSEGFSADRQKLVDFAKEHSFDLPERCMVSDLDECIDQDGKVMSVWWCGTWSGHSFGLLKRCLALFDGNADLLVSWDGGEHTGIRLRDHNVTEHKVVMSLDVEQSLAHEHISELWSAIMDAENILVEDSKCYGLSDRLHDAAVKVLGDFDYTKRFKAAK